MPWYLFLVAGAEISELTFVDSEVLKQPHYPHNTAIS